MATFEDGFYDYFEKGIFSDLSLIVGDTSINLHQLVLYCSSNVIKDVLDKIKQAPEHSFSDKSIVKSYSLGSEGVVTIALGDQFQSNEIKEIAFPGIIEYLYKGIYLIPPLYNVYAYTNL